MEQKTTNVPPPEDEEEFRYLYNRNTQTLHKWPGCRVLELVKRNRYGIAADIKPWTSSDLGKYRLEHGVIHRCRLCFGKAR